MIRIKNTLFQPLTFTLKGGVSLHLQPRETQEISAELVSYELKVAQWRGLVTLKTLNPPPIAKPERPRTSKRKRK